jgi:hypothetical protein
MGQGLFPIYGSQTLYMAEQGYDSDTPDRRPIISYGSIDENDKPSIL